MSVEEIKIWSVDDRGVVPVQPADAVPSELLLERTLVSHPEILIPGLKLVGRQTPTEGGPLDLLGVDEDGRLVLFELKRGMLSRDVVAQVIDYASYLDSLDDDTLGRHISDNSGKNGIEKIDNFQQWYGEDAEGDGLGSMRPLRVYLVGLGVDDRTERMVKFLANNGGLDIALLTFHGFRHEGRTLLARQIRVEGGSPSDEPPKTRRVDREANWKGLLDRAGHYGIAELFQEANEIFRKNWEGPQERARTYGLGFRLRGVQRSGKLARRHYARIDPVEDRLRVVFFDRAVELCPNKFQEAIVDIPYETYPRGRESNPFEPGTEIQFSLTAREWESHKDRINALASAVYEALQVRTKGEMPLDAGISDDDEDDE